MLCSPNEGAAAVVLRRAAPAACSWRAAAAAQPPARQRARRVDPAGRHRRRRHHRAHARWPPTTPTPRPGSAPTTSTWSSARTPTPPASCCRGSSSACARPATSAACSRRRRRGDDRRPAARHQPLGRPAVEGRAARRVGARARWSSWSASCGARPATARCPTPGSAWPTPSAAAPTPASPSSPLTAPHSSCPRMALSGQSGDSYEVAGRRTGRDAGSAGGQPRAGRGSVEGYERGGGPEMTAQPAGRARRRRPGRATPAATASSRRPRFERLAPDLRRLAAAVAPAGPRSRRSPPGGRPPGSWPGSAGPARWTIPGTYLARTSSTWPAPAPRLGPAGRGQPGPPPADQRRHPRTRRDLRAARPAPAPPARLPVAALRGGPISDPDRPAPGLQRGDGQVPDLQGPAHAAPLGRTSVPDPSAHPTGRRRAVPLPPPDPVRPQPKAGTP